ncbi:MAG: isocitrate/isopropylmalate family dehydrogenase [Bacteroidota bacterium]
MNTYQIAVVPGDGVGKEIMPIAWEIIETAAKANHFAVEASHFPWGAEHYLQTGAFMPEDGLDQLSKFDAIFFGAVGHPEVDDTLPAMLYTFKVRNHFRQYANYRPVRMFPGVDSPLSGKAVGDFDFVVVRENNEGEFVQNGKIFYPDEPHGLATETNVFTRQGIEQIARYAFRLAQTRRKHVTNVTKSNTLIHTLAYWDYVIEKVAQEFPDVDYRKMYVDAASANFVLKPEGFDVIVTTNMIGDILSDLGGAIMGSLGLGGSGNINPEKDYPSMFEPIHGSAPDIAGQGIANPVGQIWSGAIMLEHLGETKAAQQIMAAVDAATASGRLTVDLGGNASSQELGKLILDHLLQTA